MIFDKILFHVDNKLKVLMDVWRNFCISLKISIDFHMKNVMKENIFRKLLRN